MLGYGKGHSNWNYPDENGEYHKQQNNSSGRYKMPGENDDQPRVIPVKAVLRSRPLIPKEIQEGCQTCLEFVSNSNQVVLNGNKSFTFDYVFDSETCQEEVYVKSVKPLTEGVFKGYHATVLAYGQTGSGKTYSMGSANSSINVDDSTTGIIPRVISDLFLGICTRTDLEFSVKVSYLEVYKEELIDLLCSPSQRQPIMIRDSADGGTFVSGITEVVVSSAAETMTLMDRGNSHRTTGATAMNVESSRSHAIFTIVMEFRTKEENSEIITSKFHLVDLAGSERAKRTLAEGERLQEGIKINRGLLALGNVISALAGENSRSGHIKYRDSKLTRILQSSLGGNSYTVMIACVSPADSNHEETLNTLRYADRVRKIKNKPVVNRDPQAAQIAALKQEIQSLQLQLVDAGIISKPAGHFKKGSADPVKQNVQINKLEQENAKLTEQLQQSLESHADMCEKAILAEMARERINEKVMDILNCSKEIKADFPDLAVIGQGLEDGNVKERYIKLMSLQKLILGLDMEDTEKLLDGNEEHSIEEQNSPTHNGVDHETSNTEEHNDSHMTTAHVMKKASLGKQLQELSKALSMKQELAKKMSSNDGQMAAMRDQYETKINDLDHDIQNLIKEKSNLELALQQAHKTSESQKISEKRRQRLVELTSQIQDLKKEKKEKEKMVKLKAESDRTIVKLNTDIQDMKRTRIRLMRQIKQENEKFNVWKKEKAKEVKQLQEKNRKRNFEFVKLERTYDKQKAVLRRKTEEAAAANKRLKEALGKQQAASAKRNMTEKKTLEGTGPKIRAWLDGEIEILSSIKEAEHHLNVLLEDRKCLMQQLQQFSCDSPHKKRRTFTLDSEDPTKKDQNQEMKQELELKNAQIRELQNKLADAKEQRNGVNRWPHIGTMIDAKCALKYLVQLVVKSKTEGDRDKIELANQKSEKEAAVTLAKQLEVQLRDLIQRHQSDKTLIEQSHQDEISFLMNQMNQSTSTVIMDTESPCSSKEDQLKQKLNLQARTIGNLGNTLQQVKNEREDLHKQLLRKKTASTTTPLGSKSFFDPLNNSTNSPCAEETSDDESFSEYDSGSDYCPTPVRKKKPVPGTCCCIKTKCANGQCGCFKRGNNCSDACSCDHEKCQNVVKINQDQSGGSNGSIDISNTTVKDDTVVGIERCADPNSPNFHFPKLNMSDEKENSCPDIIPRTPVLGQTTKYQPVYFNSPLEDNENNLKSEVFKMPPSKSQKVLKKRKFKLGDHEEMMD